MNITARHWRMEYVGGSSKKFYEVYLNMEQAQVWFGWGRIGTSGQWDKKLFPHADEATDKALAQVYAKRSKGYETVREDLTLSIAEDEWESVALLQRAFNKAVRTGEAQPREVALNYIEGFVQDCNEFLVSAKEGSDDLAYSFEDLSARWEELKDKFDSAETMMDMVTKRALKRV